MNDQETQTEETGIEILDEVACTIAAVHEDWQPGDLTKHPLLRDAISVREIDLLKGWMKGSKFRYEQAVLSTVIIGYADGCSILAYWGWSCNEDGSDYILTTNRQQAMDWM